MGELKLLDCTLRDGGYLIDWEFGYNNIVSIFERLVDANIDFVEIGFIDDRRVFDINRSIMPDTKSVERIYGNLNRGNSMIVGMIDYGTCTLKNIQPCSESYLDAIRVIFKKHLRNEAMEYCMELKKLGYKVFAQLVSVTSYTDEEMMDLIKLANEIKPYAVSMVDTYGLMHQNNLKHYYQLLNNNLDPSICLGYHAHNNFQMGYANCIEMLSQKTDRTILVDGTIYGMGKSAGNAPLELIAMYLNNNYGKKYHISQILEAIDSNISNFYSPATWGYNMFYYLAASNDCHPSYVQYLMDKRTLSVQSINEILMNLTEEKKVMYDKEYAEQCYIKFQDVYINDKHDYEILSNVFRNSNVLLMGPGTNLEKQSDIIKSYIEKNHPIVLSINFIPDSYTPNYIFLSNSKRYVQLASRLCRGDCNSKIIATSNVTKTSGKFDYVLKYSTLLDNDADIVDNSFIMALKVLVELSVSRIALAGFDGYLPHSDNYINPDMEYKFTKRKAEKLNKYVSEKLEKICNIEFITDSLYNTQKEENDR